MVVKRISIDVILAMLKADHGVEPTVGEAIQHYLASVPGNWTLITVVADGPIREFYFSIGL